MPIISCLLLSQIECLCRADEFGSLRLRGGEQSFYRLVVNDSFAVRYPYKLQAKGGGILMTWQKVSLLLQVLKMIHFLLTSQSELGGTDFTEREQGGKYAYHFFSMAQDKTLLFQHAFRIAKCIRECLIHEKNGNGVIAAMTLETCLRGRSWPDGPMVLRQLKGIGVSFVRKLSMKGIKTLDQMRRCEPEQLEVWLKRSTPFGRDVLKSLEMIPKYELKVSGDSEVHPLCRG
jgi:ATP-dependent DNA helicase HFM1/MER3